MFKYVFKVFQCVVRFFLTELLWVFFFLIFWVFKVFTVYTPDTLIS